MWLKIQSSVIHIVLLAGMLMAVHLWQTRDLIPTQTQTQNLSLPVLSGGRDTLWSDKTTTLLYVWAPWCGICRLSIDNLNTIAKTYSPDKIRIITLVQDYNSLAMVKAFQQETKLNHPILMGNQESIRKLRVNAFPTYYLIDNKGTVLSHSVGYSTSFGLKVRSWLHQNTTPKNPDSAVQNTLKTAAL